MSSAGLAVADGARWVVVGLAGAAVPFVPEHAHVVAARLPEQPAPQ